MGFSDMLTRLGIPIILMKRLMWLKKLFHSSARSACGIHGPCQGTRGISNFNDSIYNTPDGMKLRNATITTIAPTGTLSIIAGCSSGIEPLFAISYIRRVLDGEKLVEVHPLFREIAESNGFYSTNLMKKIAEKGSIQDIPEIPEAVRKVFVTAHDIDPVWHIKMQAIFQKYTDNAVSKTVNFPHTATPEDVKKVYFLAHKLGCKGVTIYRDGSRKNQVLDKAPLPKLKSRMQKCRGLADTNQRYHP